MYYQYKLLRKRTKWRLWSWRYLSLWLLLKYDTVDEVTLNLSNIICFFCVTPLHTHICRPLVPFFFQSFSESLLESLSESFSFVFVFVSGFFFFFLLLLFMLFVLNLIEMHAHKPRGKWIWPWRATPCPCMIIGRGPPPSRSLRPKTAMDSPGQNEVGTHTDGFPEGLQREVPTSGSPRRKYSQAAFPGKQLLTPDPVKRQCFEFRCTRQRRQQ